MSQQFFKFRIIFFSDTLHFGWGYFNDRVTYYFFIVVLNLYELVKTEEFKNGHESRKDAEEESFYHGNVKLSAPFKLLEIQEAGYVSKEDRGIGEYPIENGEKYYAHLEYLGVVKVCSKTVKSKEIIVEEAEDLKRKRATAASNTSSSMGVT